MRRHPNYRGGTIVDKRGYVLRYVGKDHHLADCRGYAYEHRIAAEKKLGRRLLPGEIVHHRNENKSDNSPKNLQPKQSNGIHISEHFRKRNDLQPLGAENPKITCACGCGTEMLKFDKMRRPKKYAVGHALRGRKRTWGNNSWSKLGRNRQVLHMAIMRHNRFKTKKTLMDLETAMKNCESIKGVVKL